MVLPGRIELTTSPYQGGALANGAFWLLNEDIEFSTGNRILRLLLSYGNLLLGCFGCDRCDQNVTGRTLRLYEDPPPGGVG
jgi:hypothetical protein